MGDRALAAQRCVLPQQAVYGHTCSVLTSFSLGATTVWLVSCTMPQVQGHPHCPLYATALPVSSACEGDDGVSQVTGLTPYNGSNSAHHGKSTSLYLMKTTKDM